MSQKNRISPKGSDRTSQAAREILEISTQGDYDLHVVGTHGKARLGDFWTDRIEVTGFNSSPIPLLMTPARKND